MLVLSRKVGQKIAIGDEIVLCVNRISGNRVSIAIEAPDHVRIVRGELTLADDLADELDAEPGRNQCGSSVKTSPGSKAVVACD